MSESQRSQSPGDIGPKELDILELLGTEHKITRKYLKTKKLGKGPYGYLRNENIIVKMKTSRDGLNSR